MDFVYYFLSVVDSEGSKTIEDVGQVKVSDSVAIAYQVKRVNNELLSMLRINFPEVRFQYRFV